MTGLGNNMTEIEEEYLFIASGMLYDMNTWGMTLASSDNSTGSLSFLLNDNVFPPYISHKFIREDIIKIRDYLNAYLDRLGDYNKL